MCPICGSAGKEQIELRDHVTHHRFHLARCEACDVGYLNDPPTRERLGWYYENDAGDVMHKPPGALFAAMRRVSIARDLKPLLTRVGASARIVDFGTGDGSVARFLHDRGHQVRGVDIYPPSAWRHADIDFAQWVPGEPVRPELLTVGGRPADAVILRHVLEHLPDPLGTLRSFASAGVRHVFGIVPNAESRLAKRFGETGFYWDPPRHLTFFTPRSLRAAADAAGLDVERLDVGGVDEIVTSLYRRQRLRMSPGAAESGLVSLLRPTGLPAGLSSAASAVFGRGVCKFLLRTTA